MSNDKLCPLLIAGFYAGTKDEADTACVREECAMWRRGKTGAWIATNRIAYPLNAGDEAHPVMEEEVVGYCGLAGKP